MSIALQDPALAGSPETLAPCHILQHFVVFFTVFFCVGCRSAIYLRSEVFSRTNPTHCANRVKERGPKRAKERAPRFFTKSPLYLHFLVVPGAKASCHIAEAVLSLSVSAKLLPLFSGTA